MEEHLLLETERLTLRRFLEDDWPALQAYVSLPEVTKYDFEYPSSDEGCRDLARYFSGQSGIWAVCLAESGGLIGHVAFVPVGDESLLTWSLGFIFSPLFSSRGYAFEACSKVIEHGFTELGVRRVESHCHPDNERSWRLLERLSLRREGHHVESVFLRRDADGRPIWCDSLDYALLKKEWLATRGTEPGSRT